MSEAPSLRETIESAMNADAEAATGVVEAPVEVEAAPEPVAAAPQETAAEAAQRARDEKGRFAPKAAEKPNEKPVAPAVKEPVKPAAAAPEAKPLEPKPEPVAPVKAPQSWKPAVRDLAAKLPAEFRPILDEASRREIETTRVLNETAQARQFATQVQQSLAPYEGIARASGVDAMTWAGRALQTFAGLHQGTPQHKAALIAQAISAYGVDVDAVNAAMQGQPQPHAGAQPQVDVNRLVEEKFQAYQQQQQADQRLREAQAFLDTTPEFIQDVFPDMVEIMRLDRAKGGNMTPAQAYDRAVKLNEGVQDTLSKRKAETAARAQAPTVQRAKAAASSIKPSPGVAVTREQGPRSLRETIEAAVAGQRT